jgi:hypothetical protein
MKTGVGGLMILCLLLSCSSEKRLSLGSDRIFKTVGVKGDFITLQEGINNYDDSFDGLLIIDPVLYESGLVITKAVVIQGLGRKKTLIAGAPEGEKADDRVFLVEEMGKLSLHNLTVSRGNPQGLHRDGGGISNIGTLFIKDCEISFNHAVAGAGIWNHGTAEIISSRIRENHTVPRTTAEILDGTGCTGSGGGIKNGAGASLIVRDSLIEGNSSQKKGGGVFMACESTNEISHTVIRNNHSTDDGGALHLRGDLTLSNSKIYENSSLKGLGGLYNLGRLTVTSTSIKNNKRGDFKNGGGGKGFYGEGEAVFDTDSSMAVQ